jgi:hypothetical protein
MTKTVIFIISIFIISIINFILHIKVLAFLKPEFKSKKIKLLFNFALPEKKYFEDVGWKYFKMLFLLGIIELIVILFVAFKYIIK